MIYERPRLEEPLSQGDILDDCPLLLWEVTPSDAGAEPEPATIQIRVVVLTQACDLAQEKATRVLVGVVHRARQLVERGVVTEKIVRDQIRTHRVMAGASCRADQRWKNQSSTCAICTPFHESCWSN